MSFFDFVTKYLIVILMLTCFTILYIVTIRNERIKNDYQTRWSETIDRYREWNARINNKSDLIIFYTSLVQVSQFLTHGKADIIIDIALQDFKKFDVEKLRQINDILLKSFYKYQFYVI